MDRLEHLPHIEAGGKDFVNIIDHLFLNPQPFLFGDLPGQIDHGNNFS